MFNLEPISISSPIPGMLSFKALVTVPILSFTAPAISEPLGSLLISTAPESIFLTVELVSCKAISELDISSIRLSNSAGVRDSPTSAVPNKLPIAFE